MGGSDARVIMGGDEAALIRLWKEKCREAGLAPTASETKRKSPARTAWLKGSANALLQAV